VLGAHDFSSFQGAGSEVHTTVRTVRRLDIRGGQAVNRELTIHGLTPAGLLGLQVEGDGFLRHMVRNIAGTLVEIGLGRWPAARMAEILASRDRSRAGATAPAPGLVLREVLYSHKIRT
jgi:tRNA pseudouridine38-40 synthase